MATEMDILEEYFETDIGKQVLDFYVRLDKAVCQGIVDPVAFLQDISQRLEYYIDLSGGLKEDNE